MSPFGKNTHNISYNYLLFFLQETDNDSLIQLHEKNLKIPRELWLLMDYLFRKGLQTPNLFTLNRRPNNTNYSYNILEIRDWLDSWSREPFRK